MQTKLLFIQALSSLQPGTGQGVGVIDQPISREKATDLPYLPGSTIKGVFRDYWENKGIGNLEHVFGRTTQPELSYAGSVSFMDGRLLLLPVRSLAGVFAWVTSPFILNRFVRDCKMCGMQDGLPAAVRVPANDQVFVTGTTALKISADTNSVILEDYQLTPAETSADDWAEWLASAIQPSDPDWREDFKQRFCVVHDDVLSYFSENGTEVTPRIRIDDETKTASGQALWYEESLPAETFLVSIVVVVKSERMQLPTTVFDGLSKVLETPVQFGGGATVGKGFCKAYLYPSDNKTTVTP
ncbi:MAG: type III-B CRISPR module RAMP protein Cmr4 [Smithella sp.]|nr:type III-B CRISPR module RAMP protein Cmr4 [Smithella sp.]